MSTEATELSEHEIETLKTAAYGAVTLVSVAYPQRIGKANVVGAKVLSGGTGLVGKALVSKGKFDVEGRSAADMASQVLPALTATVETLRAKAPGEVANFQRMVTIAIEQAAGSTGGGINPAEAEMISKVKSAMGVAG